MRISRVSDDDDDDATGCVLYIVSFDDMDAHVVR